MTDVLGLHHTTSRVSINSIDSFAGSLNTEKAYKRFCKGLLEIGVTADMIRQKEEEICNISKRQKTTTSGQIGDSTIADQNQLLPVSDFPSVENYLHFLIGIY